MELIKAAFVGIGLMFFLTISSPSQELANVPTPSPAQRSWEIAITSTGGFHGMGDGGITIKSDGMATVSDLTQTCTLQIPLETVQDLERSLEDWGSSFRETPAPAPDGTITIPPNDASLANLGCCDLIRYSLRVRFSNADLAELQYVGSWSQYLDGTLPKSLSTVSRTALQLRAPLLKKCKG